MLQAVSQGSRHEGADGIADLRVARLEGPGASPGLDLHPFAILLDIASQAREGANERVGVWEALQLTTTITTEIEIAIMRRSPLCSLPPA